MLRFVAVHNHAALSLQFPCALIHIKNDHIHAKIHCSLLGAESCAQTRIEENHQEGLVFAKLLVCEWVLFYVLSFLESLLEVFELCYRCEMSHFVSSFQALTNDSAVS